MPVRIFDCERGKENECRAHIVKRVARLWPQAKAIAERVEGVAEPLDADHPTTMLLKSAA
jgi:hypothetical protein